MKLCSLNLVGEVNTTCSFLMKACQRFMQMVVRLRTYIVSWLWSDSIGTYALEITPMYTHLTFHCNQQTPVLRVSCTHVTCGCGARRMKETDWGGMCRSCAKVTVVYNLSWYKSTRQSPLFNMLWSKHGKHPFFICISTILFMGHCLFSLD